MGSCISKIKPRKKYKKALKAFPAPSCSVILQDKLVISPPPPPPISPPPYITTTATAKSPCTCSHNGTTSIGSTLSSISSVLSTASSSPYTRSSLSLSSDFVHPTYTKENRYNKAPNKRRVPDKIVDPLPRNQPVPRRVIRQSPSQKRARPSSPTFTRQKSLRRDASSNPTYLPQNRMLARSSPSPSRRFINRDQIHADANNAVPSRARRTSDGMMIHSADGQMGSMRTSSPAARGRIQEASCKNVGSNSKRYEPWGRQINPKNDANEIEDLMISHMEIDSLVMEEDDHVVNPHISLDCFIFL